MFIFKDQTLSDKFKLKQVSSTCGFHTVSSLCFHTTNKAQKVKVSLSPQMLAKKKKKLDKILAKYEKSSDRILKPIEENEVSVLLKREIRAGTREREKIVYTSEELESHVLLEKNWARYKMKTHLTDLRTCARMKAAQEKALNKLLEESSELYQQAIQCDDSLFPYTFKGPLKTPPKINYDAADGSYIDRTNYFDVDCGIFDDASLFERKKKVKK